MTNSKTAGGFRSVGLVFIVILSYNVAVAVEGNHTEEVTSNAPVVTSTVAASSTSTTPVTSTTPKIIQTSQEAQTLSALNILQLASHPAFKIEAPQTLTDFIRSMMKKYGEVKAAEAFQSLDSLPLGLIMKILLVEVDKPLAADIVEMQRYAQSQDKALIMMIGKIVAGDKNVPKEIFAMDQKLMKFPWWMRIRQRMFSNLEKYVAAYSLVPVSAKTSAKHPGIETSSLGVPLPKSDLASAVAASATESYIANPPQVTTTSSSTTTTPSPPAPALVPSQAPRLSFLDPIQQQQQVLELAKAAANAQAAQQLLLQLQNQNQPQPQQQQQQTDFNPLAFLLG